MEEGYLKVFTIIWLDIVLSTSFFEPLEQRLGSKSHLIIGQKFEIMLILSTHFGKENDFRRKGGGGGELKNTRYYWHKS